jgi:hypothetical protein
MKAKDSTIDVKGVTIRVIKRNGQDYVSLTDMMKSRDDEFLILNWLRNRNTVEFLGIWETVNNISFNPVEFDRIKTKAGLNNFRMSAKEWINATNSVGLLSTPGRYGGTFAHVDIAFEFGMWISAEFKVYLIKEFHRLKELESKRMNSEWNFQRYLAKVNYRIHTDAIKANLIPEELSHAKMNFIYSDEADLLNLALFGKTARQWREENPELTGNLRDHSTLEQLIVLSNLESLNAVLIEQGVLAPDRLVHLNKVAIAQMTSLLRSSSIGLLNSEENRVEEERPEYKVAS